jgi:xanthine dehydrogenase accessory factor
MELWLFIQQKLLQEKHLILLVVLDHQGSSPGRMGFKMAVASDGQIQGSIGGGQAESALVEEARSLLKKNNYRPLLRQQHHDAGPGGSGMICSGSQSVALYHLTERFLPTIDTILHSLRHNIQATIRFTAQGMDVLESDGREEQFFSEITSDNDWLFLEQCGNRDTLFIFGAGHVGLALSHIFSMLNFNVTIFDNRHEFEAVDGSGHLQSTALIDYNQAGQMVPDGKRNYVVITTFGHESDEIVLQQMLGRKIRYLGMMGSQAKVAAIMDNLQNLGYSEKQLSQVHAPVGLTIYSHTPAEIAVSIAAEIIQEKNRPNSFISSSFS